MGQQTLDDVFVSYTGRDLREIVVALQFRKACVTKDQIANYEMDECLQKC